MKTVVYQVEWFSLEVTKTSDNNKVTYYHTKLKSKAIGGL